MLIVEPSKMRFKLGWTGTFILFIHTYFYTHILLYTHTFIHTYFYTHITRKDPELIDSS